jgi:hypothetical protein
METPSLFQPPVQPAAPKSFDPYAPFQSALLALRNDTTPFFFTQLHYPTRTSNSIAPFIKWLDYGDQGHYSIGH